TAQPFLYSIEAKRDYLRQVCYYVPPRLTPEQNREIEALAMAAYHLLGCRDFARIDFRLDASGRPRFLECNPLPGLNPLNSDLVILPRGILAYDDLVQGILRAAARRWGIPLDH